MKIQPLSYVVISIPSFAPFAKFEVKFTPSRQKTAQKKPKPASFDC
jgi:hypothetical protein